jgi:outer membrane protein OmpA-like peptidoglycan-associated protein
VALRVWATINFEYNSSELSESSDKVLSTFSQALNRPALRGKKLLIVGHTDSQGSDEFNLRLSRRRAAAVGQWLETEGGLSSDRLILSGHGETSPIASNDTPEGQALNRRVEFILLQ